MKDNIYQGSFDRNIAEVVRRLQDPRKLSLLNKLGEGNFSQLVDDIEGFSSTSQVSYSFDSLQDSGLAQKMGKGTETAYKTALGQNVYDSILRFENASDLTFNDISRALNTEGGVNVFHHLPDGDLENIRRIKFRKKNRQIRFQRNRIDERVHRFLDLDIIEGRLDEYRKGLHYEPVEELLTSLENSFFEHYVTSGMEFLDTGSITPPRPKKTGKDTEEKNKESAEQLKRIQAYNEEYKMAEDEGAETDFSSCENELYHVLAEEDSSDLQSINEQLEEEVYLSRTVLTGGKDVWAKDVKGLPYILDEDLEDLDEYVLVAKKDRNSLGQPYGEVINSFSEGDLFEQ